jgi:hypothetical protein
MSYLTVKCPIDRAVSDNAMLDAINRRVLLVSKMMHRGSHVVLLTAIHCYQNNLPFPSIKDGRGATTFIRHCFNPYPRQHDDGHWQTEEVPQGVMTAIHEIWPEPADVAHFTGYGRHNTLQSNQYATNLQNHVEMNVWIYIKLTITTFCQSQGYSASKKSPFVIDLFNAIKDPNHVCSVTTVSSILTSTEQLQVDIPSRDDFIAYHRNYLDEHDINLFSEEAENDTTIGEQTSKLVLYFVHLLKYQNSFESVEGVTPRLFYPVPVHGIKRYYMDVDNEIIYYLLKDIGVAIPRRSEVDGRNINAPIFARDGLHITHFDNYFSVKQFESKNERTKFNYSNGISTDGVSISILLMKDETIVAGPPTQRKKEHRHLSGELLFYTNLVDATISLILHYYPSLFFSSIGVHGKARNKISIDPGAVIVCSFGEYQSDGTRVRSGSLLSGQGYYQETGITAARKKYERWNGMVQTENNAQSQNHYKVADWARALQGIFIMLQHSEVLWSHMFLKCRAKLKFSIYRKHQSVIARAVNSLQNPQKPDIVVLYGDGNFASGGRGRQPVPVKAFKDAVKHQYEVIEVDEFRTSSVCPECGEQLCKVLEFFNGKYYEVRGLKWCGSDACKSHPMYTRDVGVGCANIFMRYMGQEHPLMERGSDLPWESRYETPRHVRLSTQHQLPPKCLRRKYNR